MFARFVRYLIWPDIVYKNKPVAENRRFDLEPRKRVYCKGCKWLVKATSGYSCHHESNKVFAKNKKAEWLSPALDHTLVEHPKQKNRRNDCLYREVSAV